MPGLEKSHILTQLSRMAACFVVGLAFLLWIDWAYVVLPPGDGPFQTINWISRIKEGQVPGKDFDVFHGLGLLWFHALLAVPFDSVRALVYVHGIGSFFCQCVLWTLVLRMQGHSARMAFLLGISLITLMKLSEVLPFLNLAIVVNAGHSLTGARVALALISVMTTYEISRRLMKNALLKVAFIGFGGGLAAWFSTDQALASIAAVIIFSAASTDNTVNSIAGKCFHAVSHMILAGVVALGSYFTLVSLATLGHAGTPLEYWWKILPENQFWYFGGAPNIYLRHLSDMFDPTIVCLVVVGALLHGYGLVMRKPGNLIMHCGLLMYGLVSLLPLLGMYSAHYLSGLVTTGIISFCYSRMPRFNAVNNKIWAVGNVLTVLAILVIGLRMISNRKRHGYYEKNTHGLVLTSVSNASVDPNGVVPDFVSKAYSTQDPSNSENVLRAFYRGTPEIAMRQRGVGKYDYIIHALGDGQKADYKEKLLGDPPRFLRVPTQKNSIYFQWLWHQWPELWEGILNEYDYEGVYNGSAYLRRVDKPDIVFDQNVPLKLLKNGATNEIHADAEFLHLTLLRLKVKYRTTRAGQLLAKPFDKMTRVNVAASGVVDDQAFAWPSSDAYQTRHVLYLAKSSSEFCIRISADGLLFPSNIEIAEAVLEKASGADCDNLKRMLEK